MYVPECGVEEPHDGHRFITMHFKETWCGGICHCGMRGYTHGPGEHK